MADKPKIGKRLLMSVGVGWNLASSARTESVREKLYKFRKSRLSMVGLSTFAFLALISIFAGSLAPYPKDAGPVIHLAQAYLPPSWTHLFGTDDLGKDIFSRVLFGGRITLFIGLIIPLIGAGIGVPLGLIAGFTGGKTEALIMRVTDVFLSIPPLVIAILIIGTLGVSMETLIIGLSIDWWSWYVRMVHAETLSIKQQNFVEASTLLGSGRLRVIFSHILPNAIFPVIVKITLDMGYAILNVAALGFLGLGIHPPTPEWGYMVAEGRAFLPVSWWISFFPGLFIFLAILSINLIGDGLRDVFDVEVM